MERASCSLGCMGQFSPALLVLLYVYTGKLVYAQIQVDNSSGSEVLANVNNSVTLVCDLSNVGDTDIYWYTNDLGDISRKYELIDDTLPDGDKHRYSVTGNQSDGEFNLNIKNVQIRDARTYKCTYYSGRIWSTRNELITTKLTVISLPSEESPICEVLSTTGTNLPEERIGLQCSTSGGSPTPELFWYRNENELLTDRLENPLFETLKLRPEDNNIVFTCVMKTPALDAPRNCSVVPLQIEITTLTAKTTSLLQKQTTPSSSEISSSTSDNKQSRSSTTYGHTKMTEPPEEDPVSMPYYIFIAAGAGGGFLLILLIVIVIIIIICCLKKKSKKDSSQPPNRPTTGDYEMIAPQGNEVDNTRTAPDNLYVNSNSIPRSNHQGQNGQTQNEDFSLYAQPDKTDPNDEEKRLVYADLDLGEAGNDVIQTDEPTLYAKVKV